MAHRARLFSARPQLALRLGDGGTVTMEKTNTASSTAPARSGTQRAVVRNTRSASRGSSAMPSSGDRASAPASALLAGCTDLERFILDHLAKGPSSRPAICELYPMDVSMTAVKATVQHLTSLGLVCFHAPPNKHCRHQTIRLSEVQSTLPPLHAAILMAAKRHNGIRSRRFAAEHKHPRKRVETAMRELCQMGEAVICHIETAEGREIELRASGYLPSNAGFTISRED